MQRVILIAIAVVAMGACTPKGFTISAGHQPTIYQQTIDRTTR